MQPVSKLENLALMTANPLFDIHLKDGGAKAFASDNVLFDILAPEQGVAEEAMAQGARELWIAPFTGGVAKREDFMLLVKLRAGDTGPTPEATTEDTTYDNEVVVTVKTGTNFGSKTWEIEDSAAKPVVAMLIDRTDVAGIGAADKAGQPFAYIAYNKDRSATWGIAKVSTAGSPREGAHRWTFNIVFESANLKRPSENPIAGQANEFGVTGLSNYSGAASSTVTVYGFKLTDVSALNFGATEILAASFTNVGDGSFQFTVPISATAGDYTLSAENVTGKTQTIGDFTVTA